LASARLSALAAVAIAVWLAVALPVSQGAGIVTLIGLSGVALLALGLTLGLHGGVTAAAVAFVTRSAVATTMSVEVHPPLWAQVLLIVLMVELASGSFALRSRPGDPMLIVARGLTTALVAAVLVQVLVLLVEGVEARGTLVSLAGVTAGVLAAGWVTRVWHRSGVSG
jgi:hypothetical protein